jgi:hypothetical protein
MSFPSDMDFEGDAVPLDTLDMETADRLLAGAVAPEDAPPGYVDVTRLLQAAWTEPTPDEIPSEPVIVARIADVVRSSSSTASFSPHERRNPIRLTRPRIVAALVAAALASSAGLASAGALPDAIQEVASATLAKVGISVPDANHSAPTNPNGKVKRGAATPAGKSGEPSAEAMVRKRTGLERRARPTTAASFGKSRAGQRRSPSKTPNPTGGGKGSGRAASPSTTAEPTGVEKRARRAVAASVGKGRAAQHRSASRRPSSSSKARAATPSAGGKGEAASEPKSKRPTRSRPSNAGGDGRGVPASSGASGGQGSGGSGGQGSGGSGGQGSGGSGNGNSGDPRGP